MRLYSIPHMVRGGAEEAEEVCVCAGKVCVWEDKALPLMPKGGDYCRVNTHLFMIVVCVTVGLRFSCDASLCSALLCGLL